MTTPKSAAEKLLTNLPATAATALRGDRDALVELLDIAYHNGRLDALIERLDARMSDLREQRAARDATPIVEFPIPRTYDADGDRHVRVITGTGNASERRELDALCRGLRPQP